MTEIREWSLPPGDAPLRLVVLGDSTAFTDAVGPQLPGESTLYPNVAARAIAAALGREVVPTVIARAGTTIRMVHQLVTKDRHVMFDVLAGADAVILGIGGFDHAPGGIPPSVEGLVPYLRPDRLRRRVRKALGTAYPWVVRATRFRFHRTPPAEFDRLFDLVLTQVRGLTHGAPGVVLGPTSQRAAYYGGRDPRFRAAEARQFAVAARHGFPTASVWDRVEPHLDRLNVDGIHWPADVHAAVGEDAAAALIPQLEGDAPRPGLPTF